MKRMLKTPLDQLAVPVAPLLGRGLFYGGHGGIAKVDDEDVSIPIFDVNRDEKLGAFNPC
eukprot:scaffold1355_cov268-Pinguiococcus_pyrenoidosus.AAC.52